MDKKTIKVHNLDKLQTAFYTEFEELQNDFKPFDEEKNKKLQNRIIEVGFKYPVYCWENKKIKYTVDAHQRLEALNQLANDGYSIPNIPYIRIYAKNKKEAAKEILYLNSQYAEIKLDSSFLADNFNFDIDLNIEIPDMVNVGESNIDDEYIGMPDFDNDQNPLKIIISFENEADRAKFAKEKNLEFMTKQTKAWSTWYPFKEKTDNVSLHYEK